MAKNKAKIVIGWILVVLGLSGVFLPHIGFLLKLVPTLDVISHSVFEIVSGVFILIGAILINMKK